MLHMDPNGVLELRQNASRYLAEVARGETVELTRRGRLVARMVPARSGPWDEMVESGRVTLAQDDTDIADEQPGDYAVEASAVLGAMRSDEQRGSISTPRPSSSSCSVNRRAAH